MRNDLPVDARGAYSRSERVVKMLEKRPKALKIEAA